MVHHDNSIDNRQNRLAVGGNYQRLIGFERIFEMIDELAFCLDVHRAGRFIKIEQLKRTH